jgi:threonine dehydratase
VSPLDLEAIRAARERIAGAAVRTPLVRLEDREVWLKLEVLQPIGSFKIRGAANAMGQMDAAELARGVVTASAGNMAQGVAWNARRLGVPCTVVAPDHAPDAKVRAVERLGGKVLKVPFDEWWQTFVDRGRPGLEGAFVHAFDDERVMAGSGTIGLELLEDLPDVDAVMVPWGGGGLSCGIASAVKALRPQCRVVAVEVETGAPLTAALAAGEPVAVDYRPSFVDGIGSKTVFASMLERAQWLLDGTIVVTLDEVADAVRLLATRAHVVAEGAGAAPVAAALGGRAPAGRVACVVSGGSIDAATLAALLTGQPPA